MKGRLRRARTYSLACLFSFAVFACTYIRTSPPSTLKVIEMMDKADGFDENDEKLVGMLATHMGAFMRQLSEGPATREEYGEARPLQRLSTS